MSTTQPIKDMKQLKLFKEYYQLKKPNARNYLLIIMGLNSALRISDILHLTCGDVFDFRRKEWRTHITVREKKTGKENCIYMNREIIEALEESAELLLRGPGDFLFFSHMHPDEPLSRSQAFRLVKEAAFYAGLDSGVSCHSLRKTFGYHAWKQGTPPALLMNIYNHSAYQITKRYLGIEQDEKDAVFREIIL